jgi:hypothetical protein
VMVPAVDEGDGHGRPTERPRRRQPTEAATDDDDSGHTTMTVAALHFDKEALP